MKLGSPNLEVLGKCQPCLHDFINILRPRFFLYKRKLSSFSLITVGFAIFWRQNIGEKGARKILMKLTLGVHKQTYLGRIHDVQSNCVTTTLGTSKSGRCSEVVAIGRVKIKKFI